MFLWLLKHFSSQKPTTSPPEESKSVVEQPKLVDRVTLRHEDGNLTEYRFSKPCLDLSRFPDTEPRPLLRHQSEVIPEFGVMPSHSLLI